MQASRLFARIILLATVAAFSHVALNSQAGASLLGDSVTISAPGIPGGSTSVTAGAGIDLTFNDTVGLGEGPDEYITIDIGESSIDIVLYAQDRAWGWQPGIPDDPFAIEFTSLNWVDHPGATIASIAFSTSGFFAASMSANQSGPNAITALLPLSSDGADCGGIVCGSLHIDITPQHVPEPAPIIFFCLGLSVIAVGCRVLTFSRAC